MNREQMVWAVMIGGLIFNTSCGLSQTVDIPEPELVEETEVSEASESAYNNIHAYGGWYCPDNFGFPPVDIQDLDKIPVVADRLPTIEETRNGTSLMYFDKNKIPDARPLKMDLPRLAKVHNLHREMDELVIVIQVVVAGNDTIVGYRFPNGGNGSEWYRQVEFLSDDAVAELGSRPMAYVHSEINASTGDIWKAFTGTAYAKRLGQTFNEKAFFDSVWNENTQLHLNLENDEVKASGMVAVVFGNLYVHIDYDYNGFHYSEKMLFLEKPENKSVELHFAAGPFPEDVDSQKLNWENWLQEVKMKSEM